jgi:hypothetical protein
MNRNNFKIWAVCLLLISLIGCGRVSQKDYDLLKSENESLKKELDELKFGAERLLGNAQNHIANNDYIAAKSELSILLNKHVASQQAKEAKDLLPFVEQKLREKEIAEEEERKEKEKAVEDERLAKEKAERDRLANATKKLRTKYDDMKGITWYYDKSTPQYTNYNSFHIYMGQENKGKPWLRFRIQYAADNWLFIGSYIIKTDNQSYTISTSYGDVETDHGHGGIWEWYDVSFTSNYYSIVKDIIKSKNVKLRCIGTQYYKDRTITEKEKQGLQNILDAYEALGGSFSFNY